MYTNDVHFKKHKKEVRNLDAKACKFLEMKDPRYFCKLFFKTC